MEETAGVVRPGAGPDGPGRPGGPTGTARYLTGLGWPGSGAGVVRPQLASDATAVRVAAGVRVAVLVALGAAGSFLPHLTGRRAALLLLVGLVWLPWATILLFASEREGDRLVMVAGPIGDVLILAAAQWSFPSANAGVLLGYLVIVAFTLYAAGPRVAGVVGAGAVVAALSLQALVPAHDRLGSAVLVPFIVAVAVLVSLLERTAVLQFRATQRYQRLETKSDTILAHVADGVVVTDGEAVIVQANRAAAALVGRPEGALAGLRCEDAVGLHLGERRLDCSEGCGLLRLTAASGSALGVEVWRTEEGGRRQPILADATAVDSGGGRLEVVHSLRDITRLKQAEEAKTLFLATATHELKTPLTVITGFAEVLGHYDDIGPDLRASALDAIRGRAGELTRIVDRLLLSSRIEAGRLTLAVEPLDVGPVVAGRVAAVAAALGRDIGCEVAPDLPPVLGALQAVETVVDHLVDNAVKYSSPGSPIEVRVGPGGPGVRIEVSDRGVGMDADQAAHCFEKFWQAESTDVRRFGGTGIGLYIVRSLVEAMGGTVEVTSERGVGSTFSFLLARSLTDGAPGAVPSDGSGADLEAAGAARGGERTSIREFMRQIGIPERR